MSKLGALLVREGLLSESDRKTIRRESGRHRGSFARSVLALGILDEHELAALFAAKTSYRIASKDLIAEVESDAVTSIPSAILKWFDVIPLRRSNGILHVAMVDPTDRETLLQLEFFAGLQIRPVIAPISSIHAAIQMYVIGAPDYGRSEFEDFLSNHSAYATRFASGGLKKKEVASASQEEVAWGSDASEDQDSSSGESAWGASESTEMDSDASAFADTSASPDDFSDAQLSSEPADEELVDDTVAQASMLPEEAADDDFEEERGLAGPSGDVPLSAAAGGGLDAATSVDLDLNMELEGLEGDVDFDLEGEGLGEATPAAVTAEAVAGVEPTAEAGAGMDALVADTNLSDDGLAGDLPDLDLEESLGAVNLEETPAIAPVISDGALPVNDAMDLGDSLGMDVADPLEVSASDPLAASAGESLEIGDPLSDMEGGSIDLSMDETPIDAGAADISLDDLASDDLSLDVKPQEEISPTTESTADSADIDIGSADSAPVDLAEDNFGDLDMAALTETTSPDMGEISMDTIAMDEPSVDFGSMDEVAPEEPKSVEAADGLSGKGHSGIATLNRALVNMSMMMDSKKALNRLAEAAHQVGLSSGAVMMLKGAALSPGILWNNEGSDLGSIQDVPAGLSGASLAKIAGTLPDETKWVSLQECLGAEFAKFQAAWPATGNAPTHLFMRKQKDGYVTALARFSGESDHDGLKESFGELIKAVGPKMG